MTKFKRGEGEMDKISFWGMIGFAGLIAVIVFILVPLSLLKDGILGTFFYGLFWLKERWTC